MWCEMGRVGLDGDVPREEPTRLATSCARTGCIDGESNGYSAVDVSKGVMIMVNAIGVGCNCVDFEAQM